MDELNVKHQLCIFHLFKMLGTKIYKLLKSKKVSKREKIEICLYFTDIKEIFRTYDEKDAIKKLEEILIKYRKLPYAIRQIIDKKIMPDFERLTQFMKDPNIQRTSNTVENYYRQTDPEQIKTRYKTNTGIINYLNLKMKNWTAKHGKKINTQ